MDVSGFGKCCVVIMESIDKWIDVYGGIFEILKELFNMLFVVMMVVLMSYFVLRVN